MTDDDINWYEARKRGLLQNWLSDKYVQRTIDHLLDGIEREAEEQRQEGGYGNNDERIDIQRRSHLPGELSQGG